MRAHWIVVGIAGALLLGACGSRAEEPAGAPISVEELAERIAADAPPLVLDVRSDAEFEKGHIPGAVHIPHDALEARLAELPDATETEIVVHCQSGRRARAAEDVLRAHGYTHVRDLSGHWQAWQASGLPTE